MLSINQFFSLTNLSELTLLFNLILKTTFFRFFRSHTTHPLNLKSWIFHFCSVRCFHGGCIFTDSIYNPIPGHESTKHYCFLFIKFYFFNSCTIYKHPTILNTTCGSTLYEVHLWSTLLQCESHNFVGGKRTILYPFFSVITLLGCNDRRTEKSSLF